MLLPQTLEPNQRGVELYKDGAFQGYEDITTVTDEELYQEVLEADFNDAHNRVIAALKKGVINLSKAELAEALTHLLKKDLHRDGHLTLGTLD